MTPGFWTVHSDLPREGPGDADSLNAALDVAGVQPDWQICDLACGPGADLADLAARAGQVVGIDGHGPFIEAARRRTSHLPNVSAHRGAMAAIADFAPAGGFDMIWCAGALYFLGGASGLKVLKGALRPGGLVAFSEPCVFQDTPEARAFWEGYPAQTREGIALEVAHQGFQLLADWRLSDAAWEAYYSPMETRLDRLEPGATGDLADAIAEARTEIADWRRLKVQTGYLLVVARLS